MTFTATKPNPAVSTALSNGTQTGVDADGVRWGTVEIYFLGRDRRLHWFEDTLTGVAEGRFTTKRECIRTAKRMRKAYIADGMCNVDGGPLLPISRKA